MANSGRVGDQLFRQVIGLIDEMSIEAAFDALRNGSAALRFRKPRDQFVLDNNGNRFATREVASQAVQRSVAAHSLLNGLILDREDFDDPRDRIVRKKLDDLRVVVRSKRELDDPAPEAYVPSGQDTRKRIPRDVVIRPGQGAFKDALIARYGPYCLVTGVSTLEVLEAAHICPYLGDQDDHPENGLLLRADIHTLFDRNMLRIAPENLVIEIASSVTDECYLAFVGNRLRCPSNNQPSARALHMRYRIFKND